MHDECLIKIQDATSLSKAKIVAYILMKRDWIYIYMDKNSGLENRFIRIVLGLQKYIRLSILNNGIYLSFQKMAILL